VLVRPNVERSRQAANRSSKRAARRCGSSIASIVQQYAGFKESRIRSAVFGNSRHFFLMRQADLDDMARDIGLSELTKHAILLVSASRSAERRKIRRLDVTAQRCLTRDALHQRHQRRAVR